MKYSIQLILCSIFFPVMVFASKVEIVKKKGRYQLLKDGNPYYIKGAGGTENLEKLKKYAGRRPAAF